MTATLSVDVRASIHWLHQDALGLSVVADRGEVRFAEGLAHGLGDDQADELWHDERTLAGSDSETLDLSSLPRGWFGGGTAVALATVKALLIVNRGSQVDAELLVGGAASAAWSAPLGGSGERVRVGPASSLLLSNKTQGWPVTSSTADKLKIANAGSEPVTYQIVIVGTSA